MVNTFVSIASALIALATRPQILEYEFDGQIYCVESTITDFDSAYFVTLDGRTVYVNTLE